MTRLSCSVGYGRPPRHTRFQKGKSGNPGGRPGPKKRLKQQFDAALREALNADEKTLRQSKPAKVIEAFARQLVLQVLDGRPSAQRLVLSTLREEDDDADVQESREMPGRSEEERSRRALGERYDEFNRRFDAAVAAGRFDDFLALDEPSSNSLSEGIPEGISEKDGVQSCPTDFLPREETVPSRLSGDSSVQRNSLHQGNSQGISEKDRAKDVTLNRRQRRRLASLARSHDMEEARLGKIAAAALSWNSGGSAAISMR